VAVGDLAAAVAAGAAVWSVRLAKQAVEAAREAIELTDAARREAEAARRDAEAARSDAERDRQRHRLVRVGEIVEDVFWTAEQDLKYNPATDGWYDPRNRLRHALVGLTEALPRLRRGCECRRGRDGKGRGICGAGQGGAGASTA
jgi:hypothetical protein